MSESDRSVFISYRRDVGSFIARSIFLSLTDMDYDVFLDVETIDSGRFESIILEQIAARRHFVVILTPGAVERCRNPGDWLRREIETAIELERNIVPVLINNFSFREHAGYLTGNLEKLETYNAVVLYHDYFNEGIQRLGERFLAIDRTIPLKPARHDATAQQHISSITEQPPPTSNQLAAESAYDLGMAAYYRRDYPTARKHFTDALTHNPDYRKACWRRGESYFGDGNIPAALQDWNQALQLDPSPGEAARIRSAILIAQNSYARALVEAEKALKLEPTSPYAYFARAFARHRMKDYAGAIADYTAAITHHYDDQAWVYANRAAAYSESRQHERALQDYTKALEYNDRFTLAYINRGNTHYRMGDYAKALENFNRAIELNPTYPVPYNSRGNTCRRMNNMIEAIANYNQAIRLNPRYYKAYNNRGLARRRQGDIQGAIADYTQAIRLNPSDIDAHYNRAVAFQDLREFAAAIRDYQRYLELGGGQRDGDGTEIRIQIETLQQLLT